MNLIRCAKCEKHLCIDTKLQILDGYQIDRSFICNDCDKKYRLRKKWCNNRDCTNWTIFRNEYCLLCEEKYKRSLATELKQHIPQLLPELHNIILGFSGEARLQLWQISQ